MKRPRLALIAAILLVAIALPAGSMALPAGFEGYPRVAVVARGDNPVDALAASSLAGMLGGIVVLTPTASLHPAAQRALQAFAPDIVVIAGDETAVSALVEAQVQGLGYPTKRAGGDTRYETAEELAALVDWFELGRPVLSSDPAAPHQVDGDVAVEGAVISDHVEAFSTITSHGALVGNTIRYETYQTRVMSVPPEAFRPDDDGTFKTESGATRETGSGLMSAPLHLPDGARVTSVTFHVRDNSDSNIQMDLESFSLVTRIYTKQVTRSTSGKPGNTTLQATGLDILVDNTDTAYMLVARPIAPGTWDGANNLLAAGATIEYRVFAP